MEFGSIGVNCVIGGQANQIPGVSDVTKLTVKTAGEAAVEVGKEKAKEELEKH